MTISCPLRMFTAVLALVIGMATPIRGDEARCLTGTEVDRRASDAVFRHANDFRVGAGRRALTRYESLDEVARQYARFLCESDQFAHVTEEGFDVLDRARIFSRSLFFSSVGENLYLLKNTGGEGLAFDLSNADERGYDMQDGWEESPGHRKNLLRSPYNGIGIGVAYARDRILGVQVFAKIVGELPEDFAAVQNLTTTSEVRITFRTPVAAGTEACLVQTTAKDEDQDEENDGAREVGCATVNDWTSTVEVRIHKIGLSNLDLRFSDGTRAWGPQFMGVR